MKRFTDQEMELFRYQENLRDILRDLKNIRALTPAEISRHGALATGEAAAIIEARKSDLLSYVQTICEDHIWFGEQLLSRTGVYAPRRKLRKK